MKTPKITNLILLLSAATILQSASHKKSTSDLDSDNADNVLIHDLNDSNFESFVGNGTKNPWFLTFYVESCPHCKNAKKTLKSISNNPDSISKSRIKLGQIDCDVNMFTCYRFKVSRVPYIAIIDSNHLYELSEYPSKENLVGFINMRKDTDEGSEVPKAVGYVEFFYKSMEELVQLVNTAIEGYLRNSLGFKVGWKSEYTIGLLALLLVLIVVVEYAILSFICKIPKSNNKGKKAAMDSAKDSKDVATNAKDIISKDVKENTKKESNEETVIEKAASQQQDAAIQDEKTEKDKKDD